MGGVHGIFARPFVDLEPYVDTSRFAAMHEEICLALTQVPLHFTGGSHKSMGIVPPSLEADAYADYGHAIAKMSRPELVIFASLSDAPLDPDDLGSYAFGEERDAPLSRRQMLYLKFKYGVYFPWKVYYELMPNSRWETKASAHGKAFTREAQLHFPRTVAFVRSLPFAAIGSCKLLGLEANDHGTVHRDRDPEAEPSRSPDAFVSFCPKGDKRLYLWDEAARSKTFAPSRAYWFNDGDYHGVEADPFFRYSIRVDGVFDPAFASRLASDHAVA